MQNEMLSTFQLVNQDRVISPILTTTRMYGVWFENVFDKYTALTELYLKAKKKDGEQVLEWHPGTRIGHWFDTNDVDSTDYKSWFIMQESPMMERLVKLKLAEQKDAIPISVNDIKNRRMIRVYTVSQIELYLKNVLDKNFRIADYVSTPKQIKVKDTDMNRLIMPRKVAQRRKLF